MKKNYLPKFLLILLTIICLLSLIFLGLKKQNPLKEEELDSLVLTPETLQPTPTPIEAKIYTDLATNDQQIASIILVYQPKSPQTLTAFTAQVRFESYQPENESSKPFMIDEATLKTGWQVAVNSWECSDNHGCLAKLGLLAVKPGGMMIDQETKFASIIMPPETDKTELDHSLDWPLTQALTQEGKSVTIVEE